ncbi:putative Protein phosphatase 1 regulatory subunit 37 like protein [Blattamonas nauphoetae]|uniref:Uncharacterized protein n=1 Tax=Blattamonas nauphoetae TaxID=2049346 RepID=A0ABQ9XWG8_9EUKA|nr:putative Protein phosphatase 1 regulatory subunit 37 like protein [Blattamonas nauphoetae]
MFIVLAIDSELWGLIHMSSLMSRYVASCGVQTTIGLAQETLRIYNAECAKKNVKPDPEIIQHIQAARANEDPFTVLSLKNRSFTKAHIETLVPILTESVSRFLVIADFEGSLKEDTVDLVVDAVYHSRTIEVLNLQNCKEIGTKTCTTLSSMIKNGHSLRFLNISQNEISSTNLSLIVKALGSQYSVLQVLKASGITPTTSVPQIIPELCQSLSTNTTLLTLSLADDHLTPSSADSLSVVLENTIPLPPAPTPLAQGMSEEQDHTDVSLITGDTRFINSLNDVPQTMFMYSSQLAALDFRMNQMGDSGLQAISKALKTNNTLLSLVLWSNRITAAGITHLCAALKENTTLQNLELGCNQIGTGGTTELVSLLEVNRNITALGVAQADLSSDDLVSLSGVLADPACSLFRLDLRNNPRIGFRGISKLVEAIETNTRIQCIALDVDKLIEHSSPSEKAEMQKQLTRLQSRTTSNVDAFIKANDTHSHDAAQTTVFP